MSHDKVVIEREVCGTGRTTSQMKSCKHGGVFVVHSSTFVPYCEAIKRKINRPDIEIVSVGQIAGGWATGRIYPEMKVDHFAMSTMSADDWPHVQNAILQYRQEQSE